jgi:NAD(P)H-dependent FMN reductase
MNNIRILCLSGSLRKASYNTALINAIRKLAPNGIDIAIFEGMGNLPLFNPDRETDHIPSVDELRNEIKRADGLLIASPEYAHGISAVLKNALDWLVSGNEFPEIPVAILNASPRASHAQAALREVITTMSGKIVEDASVSIGLLGSNLDANGIVHHPEISRDILHALGIFRNAIIDQAKLD